MKKLAVVVCMSAGLLVGCVKSDADSKTGGADGKVGIEFEICQYLDGEILGLIVTTSEDGLSHSVDVTWEAAGTAGQIFVGGEKFYGLRVNPGPATKVRISAGLDSGVTAPTPQMTITCRVTEVELND
jgi:hypothetical protein